MHRPNILMVTCHDLGQHLGCYGAGTVQSPHLDKLASRGIRFENVYSTSAVCERGRRPDGTPVRTPEWARKAPCLCLTACA